MTFAFDTSLPFGLSLHQRVLAVAGEVGVLTFCLHNTGVQTITAYSVGLSAGPFAEAPAPARSAYAQLPPGCQATCILPFRTDAVGAHPFEVQVRVALGGEDIDAVVASPITVQVQSRKRGGNIYVELPQGGLCDGTWSTGGGDVDVIAGEGSMPKHIETQGGDVRLKAERGAFIQGINTSAPEPVARVVVMAAPDAAELVPLQMVRLPPEWGRGAVPGLQAFAEGWRKLGRSYPLHFKFIDQQGELLETARAKKDSYRLSLLSAKGGHVTLLTKGAGGSHYQLLPHRHFGTQHAQRHQRLYFPGDPNTKSHERAMLFNLGDSSINATPHDDDALGPNQLNMDQEGQELALIIISPEPVTDCVLVFQGWEMRSNVINHEQLGRAMHKAWSMPHCEVGLASLRVMP